MAAPDFLNLIDVTKSPYTAVANNSTDCTVTINAAITAAGWGQTIYFPPGGSSYRVSGALNDVPMNIGWWQDGEGLNANQIAYDGPQNRPVLTIGELANDNRNVRHRIRISHRNVGGANPVSDFTNETYMGVKIMNHHNCKIDLDLVSGFPIGAQIVGQSTLPTIRGSAGLEVHLGRLFDSRIGLDIGGRGTGGWMNGCTFYGGWMHQGGVTPTSLTCYSVRHSTEGGESIGIWFINPIVEVASGGGPRIGFYVPATSSARTTHHVMGVHSEGQDFLAQILQTGRCTYRSSYSHPSGADPIDHGGVQSYSTAYYENETTERSFSASTTVNFIDLANRRLLRYTGTGGHTLTLANLPPGAGVVPVENRGTGTLLIAQGTLTTLLGSASIPVGRSAALRFMEYGSVCKVLVQ